MMIVSSLAPYRGRVILGLGVLWQSVIGWHQPCVYLGSTSDSFLFLPPARRHLRTRYAHREQISSLRRLQILPPQLALTHVFSRRYHI